MGADRTAMGRFGPGHRVWMRSFPYSQQPWLSSWATWGRPIPAWMGDEAEMRCQDHVISKGTVAVLIYKAMLADATKGADAGHRRRSNNEQSFGKSARCDGLNE